MQSGRLKHRGTIQQSQAATNAQGQSEVSWVTVAARVSCRVDGDGRNEVTRAFAQQQQADVIHKVEMRWRSDVGNGMRFIWHDGTEDRTMSITSRPINPDGRHGDMVLICKEPL